MPSNHLVLMAEDDRTSAAIQKQKLDQAGLDVFSVASGADALLWSPALPLAAILLDISLPDVDGSVVALHLLRQQEIDGCAVPIIAMTALEVEEDNRVKALGGLRLADIWHKPLDSVKTDLLRTTGSCDYVEFYNARDPMIANDVKQALGAREEQLKLKLQEQVIAFHQYFIDASINQSMGFMAHAVKSSALAMGYNRLAALMSAIELSTQNASSVILENRQVIADCITSFQP